MSNDGTITENNEATATKPFGIRDKIGYLCGDLRTCFILGLANSFLMTYYTNVLGISGVIVGLFYFMTKLFDAFADVGVERLCDTSKPTVHGRFSPWVRRMKYPSCIIAVVLFLPFMDDFSYMVKIIYIYCPYFIYDSLLSTVSIPYGAMPAAINLNLDDRVLLSTWCSVGSVIDGGAADSFIPTLMYTILVGGSQVISGQHLFWIPIGCAVLGLIFLSLTCHLTTERVRVERKESMSVSVLLKGPVRSKALVVLMVVGLLIVINQGLSGTNITYLFNDYFHNKEVISVALLFTFGSLVLLAPSALWLTKRFGRKEASVGALFLAAVMYVIMYFIHIMDAKVYLAFLLLATLGTGSFDLMIWAFMTDVCGYHQYVAGDREDGMVYGVNFFVRKVDQARAGVIGGFMLAITGYQSSSAGGAARISIVQENIYTMVNLLPALCLFLVAVILIYFYSLNRTETLKMEGTLNELNGTNK